MPMHLRKRQRQQEQCGELRRKRLGRSDTNFNPSPRNKRQLTLAHHRARRNVANRQRVLHA